MLSERMTTDGCDSMENLQTTFAEMLVSNTLPRHCEDNVTKNSSCGFVSIGFPITMMITGMVGNSFALILVCISYRKKENKRKRSFLLCIGSLALTDLFGQLLTSPIVISVYRAQLKWESIDSSGRLCSFFGVCMITFGLCALFLASAMAIERALAITCPHWYSSHMKTSVTKQTLAVIWLLVLLFALLPIAGVGEYTPQWPGTWCFISTGDRGNMFFAITFAVLGIFSLLVTLSCNVLTIRGLIIRCKTKSGTSQSSRQWERLTTETVIQLLGIMCVLLICWSPLLVLMVRMISSQVSSHQCNSTAKENHSSTRDAHLDCNFFLTTIRLASLNQILDPWVYLLFREILLRKFCIMANAVSNAVSNCSIEDQRETQTALDALNNKNQESNSLHKPQGS
ncbi:prostaglandin E2 receptor EP3 subtype [Toxotes jaculatrix]|uniref:prostaglandin E2 receptor EP3 subtype n=1 Tax=Toxotes jaculatrix TaxID=941984 RepID=UPI001B3AB93A|nr:prostaglandin E2 receptor EP3 subtype [Toxotes jaculatrix]